LLLVVSACSANPVAAPPSASPSATAPASEATEDAAPIALDPGAGASAIPDDVPSAAAVDGTTPPPSGSIDDPPLPGRYRYRQDGYQTFGALRFNFDPEGTFDVADAERDGASFRQRTVRRYASSREREASTLFRRDAILLEEAIERIGAGNTRQTFTCRTPEPVPILPIPWRVGATWTGGGTCSGLQLSYEATLRAVEERMIDGASVRALVIDAAYTIDGEDLRQETETTIWFAPDHRLSVRQVERSSGEFQGTPFTRELTEELVSLGPTES
jgi:hypothetical protein